ncbi:MAG: GNAT family N-acetyltransferase [Cellulosilyticaceae bacterium]
MKGLKVRLRRFDEIESPALAWYQDAEMLRLVDGEGTKPYDEEMLKRMYSYLQKAGELYWIEVEEAGAYKMIGDVTLCEDDLPIVIGDKNYRGCGVGSQVIELLKERARELGFTKMGVKEIYHYNKGSQQLFEKVGFYKVKETEKGWSYRYDL